MPRKIELNDIESIDVLKEEVADFVIDDYCKLKRCPYIDKCFKGAECKFTKSIERAIRLIHRQERKIRELYKEIGEK